MFLIVPEHKNALQSFISQSFSYVPEQGIFQGIYGIYVLFIIMYSCICISRLFYTSSKNRIKHMYRLDSSQCLP